MPTRVGTLPRRSHTLRSARAASTWAARLGWIDLKDTRLSGLASTKAAAIVTPLGLRAGRYVTSLMVLPVEDFPAMTEGKLPHRFVLPAATLRERAHIAANEGRTLGTDYASWARINLACAPDVASRIVERVLGLL